jgi:hypothetical protein
MTSCWIFQVSNNKFLCSSIRRFSELPLPRAKLLHVRLLVLLEQLLLVELGHVETLVDHLGDGSNLSP